MGGKRKIYYAAGTVLIMLLAGITFVCLSDFLNRALFFLLLCSLGGTIRLMLGHSAADRAAAVLVIGMLVIGVCAMMAIATGKSWYLDIAFVWGMQSFIVSLLLGKFLEGKRFDE